VVFAHPDTDTTYPSDLPKPQDDGACNHLTSLEIPSISLPPTSNPSNPVNISQLPGLTVIFCYPRTGAPGEVVPPAWDSIPGARGCTPQACSFRDNLPQLKSLGVTQLYGLSTQDSQYQQEVHTRLHLPYDLLSDEKLEFQRALNLPTFEWEGHNLIRRLTLAIEDGKVVKWWYPIFPPDSNVSHVIEWLKERNHKQ
jgi:peroxiredoxin